MPSYKLPQLSQVVRSVVTNTGAFLKKAGTIIFCFSVILWAMTYYPRLPETRSAAIERHYRTLLQTEDLSSLSASDLEEYLRIEAARPPWIEFQFEERETPIRPEEIEEANRAIEKANAEFIDNTVAAEQLRYSLAGRFGHLIEPVIKPLGYDWKMGVGLVGAFAAREVFVSTMGIVYSAGDSEDDTSTLQQAMTSDRYGDGRPVWTPLVAVSLLVWFVLAMQCMSTLAIVRRETGGWKWPIGMLVYMNGLAYVVSLVVYQVGRIWWT
jgi:ferrous iron transport protein B